MGRKEESEGVRLEVVNRVTWISQCLRKGRRDPAMWRAGGRAFKAEGTTSAKAPRQHLWNRRAYLGGSGQRSLGPSGTNQHKDDAFNLNEVEAIG